MKISTMISNIGEKLLKIDNNIYQMHRAHDTMFVTIKFFFFLSIGKSVLFVVIENNSIDINAIVETKITK